MPEPLTVMSLVATLYATGIVTVPEARMSFVEPAAQGTGIVLAQYGCSAQPANCKTGLPVSQICKRTTPGQRPGILWINCSVEGLPTMWKATVAPCTCSS